MYKDGIKIGDVVRFKNLRCHVLLYKIYGKGEFSTKEVPIEDYVTAEIVFRQKLDFPYLDHLILYGNNQLYIICTEILFNNKFTMLNPKETINKEYPIKGYPNKWTELVKNCAGKCHSPQIKFLYSKIFFPKDKFSLIEKIKAVVVYRVGLFLSTILNILNYDRKASNLKGKIYKYLNHKVHPYLTK